MATASFSRLIRFVPCSNPASVMIGEPDPGVDIGHELREGRDVYVSPWSGSSVLEPGARSSRRELVQRVLSPLASNEVGTIRCIGLNYVQHAREIDAEIPTVPTVFLKPSTSLADPWPAPTILPAITQRDDSGDYEAELAIIIGKECKNVPENEALEYVLGYTACNDISSRASQFAQSQWCYSKGFDGSCPLGEWYPLDRVSRRTQLPRSHTGFPSLDSRPVQVEDSGFEEQAGYAGLYNRRPHFQCPDPCQLLVPGHNSTRRNSHHHRDTGRYWRSTYSKGVNPRRG